MDKFIMHIRGKSERFNVTLNPARFKTTADGAGAHKCSVCRNVTESSMYYLEAHEWYICPSCFTNRIRQITVMQMVSEVFQKYMIGRRNHVCDKMRNIWNLYVFQKLVPDEDATLLSPDTTEYVPLDKIDGQVYNESIDKKKKKKKRKPEQ